MIKKDLYVKISGRWYRVTSADGIDAISGEEFHLFLDDLEDAKVINEGVAVKEPTTQQQPNFDVISAKIQLANTFVANCDPSENEYRTAEQAVRFANTVIENILKSN
jgi:hypothetical protein